MSRATAPRALLRSTAAFDRLVRAVRVALMEGQAAADRAYLASYHRTGQHIDAYILHHRERAPYGEKIIPQLAAALHADERLLYRCLRFYRAYPILADRPELGWSHYRALIDVADKTQRDTLTREASTQHWTSPELERRVRALNAIDVTPRPESPADAAKARLTLRRGTPGVCRVIADGPGVAVDLGFASYLALSEGARWAAGDFVRVTADGVVAAKAATKSDLFTYRAEVLKVIDGDTLWVKIFLRPDHWVKEKVRLRDLDCPEIATSEGRAAQRFTAGFVAQVREVTITTTKPDKYDRYLADVFLTRADGTGVFLNNALLEAGHAAIKRAWQFGDWT